MDDHSVQAVLSRNLVLGEMLARNARKFSDKTALVFREKRFTYAELNRRVNALSHALLARRVRRGDKVALLLHNCSEVVEGYFACNKIGAVAVPVNFRLVENEIRYVLENAEASVLVFEDSFRETAAGLMAGLPQLRHWIRVGGDDGCLEWAEAYEALIAQSPAGEPLIEVHDTDDAFLMYTSGTTGRPKGAVLTHKNLFVNTTNWIIEVGADSDSVWVSGLQLFHIGGLDGILPFVFLGATNVLLASTGFDAEEALQILERERATHCYFVPTQWQEFIHSPRLRHYDLSHLKKAMWGASTAPDALLKEMSAFFPGMEIINAFGQTEMSSNTTFLKGKDAVRKRGSVGKPVVNLEVRVVDDRDRDAGSGEIGEILYRGPTVFKEYYRNPDETAAALRDGWFHSGDMVRQDAEGYYYVVDRKKDMIISGGENIYPAELERVLYEHGQIKEAAVIGVPHPKWVETPLAVVVLKPGETLTAEEVIAFCRENLASYKKPGQVVFADSLPRNAAGKIQKPLLRERYRR